MKPITLTFIFTFSILLAEAQNKMRPINQLINETDPGWTLVQGWMNVAKNKIEILPVDKAIAEDVLYKTQVTTRSPMGAIVYMTGGLLIDDGWIRILGSGCKKLSRTLADWNKGRSFKEYGEAPQFLLIADDAIGGFYLLNGGALGKDLGKVYYFSPDNLQFEPLDLTYTDFLLFCFNNDLDKFYEGHRWENWRREVSNLDGNMVYSFYPFLWTKESKDINKISRKVIPVSEQYDINIEMQKQLNLRQK